MKRIKLKIVIALSTSILLLRADEIDRPNQTIDEIHTTYGTEVDFFDSMEWETVKNKSIRRKYFTENNRATETMFFLKSMYDKNNFFKRPTTYETKIPKKIHQIWIGPKTPPKMFKASQESLKTYHPDWEYKLWTDEDIPGLQLYNQKFYDLSNNYGEKSDIVRYEILNKFGGIYVDVDFLCFKPFDVLLQYNFWASIEPLDACYNTGINNAIIGSIPNHPILRHCIETIKESWYSSKSLFVRVGPIHLKESFLKYAHENYDDETIIALPKSFFYPLDFNKRFQFNKAKVDYTNLHSIIKPESFAVHLWAGSWVNKKGR